VLAFLGLFKSFLGPRGVSSVCINCKSPPPALTSVLPQEAARAGRLERSARAQAATHLPSAPAAGAALGRKHGYGRLRAAACSAFAACHRKRGRRRRHAQGGCVRDVLALRRRERGRSAHGLRCGILGAPLSWFAPARPRACGTTCQRPVLSVRQAIPRTHPAIV